MFELMFRDPDVIKRHQESPLLQARIDYLSSLLHRGTSERRVMHIASMLVMLIHHLNLTEMKLVSRSDIEDATRKWSLQAAPGKGCPCLAVQAEFARTGLNWLRFHGLLREPVENVPYGDILHKFTYFLRMQGNKTDKTIAEYTNRTKYFLRWAAKEEPLFSNIGLSHIERYMDEKRAHGVIDRSIFAFVGALKVFFRFTGQQGLSPPYLAAGIRSPRVSRYHPQPQGAKWLDVRRLLARPASCSQADLRARAIIMLFAICGLRSGEVSKLALKDIDWIGETFTVRRLKNGRTQTFPLPYEVGEAILEYLRDARPICTSRNVFVTLTPPYREVLSMRQIVADRMIRLNIKSPRLGSHSLRHSCATQLLAKGIPLKEIADFLGHSGTSTVCLYAKSSPTALRRVAEFKLDVIS